MPQSRSGGKDGTRPTTDRVRESLFNVLTARMDLSGVAVLDLYAGSGALGIEAVSRGRILGPLRRVGPSGRGGHHRERREPGRGGDDDPLRGRRVGRRRRHPPARLARPRRPAVRGGHRDVEALIAGLDQHGWTEPDTIAVFERPASGDPVRWPAGWAPWRERRYGDTRLEMAQREG